MMINLPKLANADISGKKVLVRMDLDVDEDFSRIDFAKDTLKYLIQNNAKIIVLGHKGRPEGSISSSLSLRYLLEPLEKTVEKKVIFVENFKTYDFSQGEVFLLENLRFDSREESNDTDFTHELASLGDFYVNEAFAVCHREHASIVGLPKVLPHAAGLRLGKEIEILSAVLENPKRPIVAVISGVKEDKMDRIASIVDKVDKVLVGGRLPLYYGDDNPNPDKLILARLLPDKEDITIHSIEVFIKEIGRAKTIIVAGVPGKYEDEGHRQGTKAVFEAVANSSAFKILGGGDAEAAITLLGLNDKFDWISVGGGAMLEFLAKGTLPGIEVLVQV